jgi:bacterioferritin-associated ferredoxin
MYICLCEAVSDKTIKQAMNAGCQSVKEIRHATGAASKCCKCVPMIQEILTEHVSTRASFVELKMCS